MKALIVTALLALAAAPVAAQNITAPPPPIPDEVFSQLFAWAEQVLA